MSKKTITITYGDLARDFYPAITSLGTLQIKGLDALISIAKTRNTAKTEYTIYSDMVKQIAEEKCDKDESGKPIIEEKGLRYSDIQDGIETNRQIEELNKKEIEMQVHPIDAKDLKGVEGLTGNMISGLGEFMKM